MKSFFQSAEVLHSIQHVGILAACQVLLMLMTIVIFVDWQKENSTIIASTR